MLVENQTRPGDLTKFVVKIGDNDISDAVTDAHIFQDIFSPNWTANIILRDSSNLLMILPILPGDKVTVEIETKMGSETDDLKEFSFIISAITDKILENPGTYSYTLACVHETSIKQQTKRISKAYTDKKVSDIVKNICQEYLDGDCEAIETDNSVSLLVPNKAPLSAIAWISKMALKDKAADFFFYQIDDDKYAFKNFETMFSSDEENVPVTLTNGVTELRDEKANYQIDYMLNIGQYHFQHFDAVSNLNTGFYKNKLLSYDVVNKKWESKVFTYGDDCPQDAEMKSWDDPIFDNAENFSISFKPKHPGSFSRGSNACDSAGDWLTSRKSAIQKADQERLIAQLPGGVGTWKWLGKNINVDILSQEDRSGETKDKYRDGKYVVACVAHMISKAFYAVNLEMVKKRLNEKPEVSRV